MRWMVLIVMVLACGREPTCNFILKIDVPKFTRQCTVSQLGKVIDPEILELVSDFSKEAMARNVPCAHTPKMEFVDSHFPENPSVLGYCTYFVDVVLVREYWNWLTPESRRTLIYHELGHCALLQGHTDPSITSIMNPYILSDGVSVPNWDMLVNNLFAGEPQE